MPFARQALADMDWKRMKRDLSIQESILDQFLETKKGSTTGLYIENHGVVLIASGGIKYGDGTRIRVRTISRESIDIAIPDKRAFQIQTSRGKKMVKMRKKKSKVFFEYRRVKAIKAVKMKRKKFSNFS